VIPFADNFLAGALITLLIPGTTLVAVAVWYARTVIRRERDRERGVDEGGTGRAAP
jgi:hypothetical protein